MAEIITIQIPSRSTSECACGGKPNIYMTPSILDYDPSMSDKTGLTFCSVVDPSYSEKNLYNDTLFTEWGMLSFIAYSLFYSLINISRTIEAFF